MGKRFGQLGVTVRGIFYYVLSPHEQKPYAGAFRKGIPNIVSRTNQTIMRWLPTFVVSYLIYKVVEISNWASNRKNPKDYSREIAPPLPKICRRVIEPRPDCKKDWEYEEYVCAEGEEPDEEFAAIMEIRNAEILAAEQ